MVSQLDRRQALKLFAGLGAAATVPGLAACSGSSLSGDSGTGSSGGPVKIGMLAPQSGVYKVIGDDMINGFNLYLEMHDNKLGGREVDLVIADEGETADSGRTGAEKLLKQDKVLAMTGVVSSAVMGAIVDLVETEQVPLVGSNASPTTLQGATYIWRTSYVNDEPGKALGAYLGRTLKGTVYCIAADYQAGKDEVNGLLSTLPKEKLHSDPVYTPFAPNPTTNFQPYLTAIKQSGAEAVFSFYAGSSAVDFVKQYAAVRVSTECRSTRRASSPKAVCSTPRARRPQGIFTALNYSPDLDNPANRTFASDVPEGAGGAFPRRTRWPRTTRPRCWTRRSPSPATT